MIIQVSNHFSFTLTPLKHTTFIGPVGTGANPGNGTCHRIIDVYASISNRMIEYLNCDG